MLERGPGGVIRKRSTRRDASQAGMLQFGPSHTGLAVTCFRRVCFLCQTAKSNTMGNGCIRQRDQSGMAEP